MAVLYVAAGLNHFVHPGVYRKIMPAWLPWHTELVFISGICEIVFGVLLLVPATKHLAAWGIIALLIAVFPANIQMMLNDFPKSNARLWMSILRLPLQLLLIWWAYNFTK